MRPTLGVAMVIGLVLSSCASAGSGTPEASSTATAEATRSPLPTATVTPTPEPTPEATASPFGAAVFSDPDDCTHPDAGYRVAYPDDWYSNAAGEGIAACWLFAPRDFGITYGTEIPAEVAIVIRRFANLDDVPGPRVISDDPAVVDGLQARRQEVEITERTITTAPGHRQTRYLIELPDEAYLVAQTYLGFDYDLARSVLDDMMRTLQVDAQ